MLDLATAKAYLRVTNDAQDGVIAPMLAAAIKRVETITGHLLSPREVTEGVSVRRQREVGGIRLFKAPVNEVTAITYLDGGADPDTDAVSIDEWQLVEGSEARLLPGWGASWPTLDVGQVLTVKYSAGYAADAVPADLELAVLKLVAHEFHHRGDDGAKPPELDELDPYRPLPIA